MHQAAESFSSTVAHSQIRESLIPAMRASEDYYNTQKEIHPSQTSQLDKMQRENRRRLQMTAIFKGFDISESGVITLEGFKRIGTALNWGQWSDSQNRKLHSEMDTNGDKVISFNEWWVVARDKIHNENGYSYDEIDS